MFAAQSTLQSACASARTFGVRQLPAHYSRTAACRALKKEDKHAASNFFAPLCLGVVAPSLPVLQALADEVAPVEGAGPTILGLPAQQFLLLTGPVLLYTVFSVYRTAFNPNLKVQDFLFFLAATVIIGNIASILVFRIRYF